MKEAIKFSKYTHRFLARFVIEAKTPLAVGSGEKDVITDALVATDANGLPYIQGTAIAGIVRHMIDDIEKEQNPTRFEILKEKERLSSSFFGYPDKSDGGHGSKIIFTEAKIINSKGEVIDGMNLGAKDDYLLKAYSELPIRQHVRINEKGVTDKAGKFDEQVVFAGTRFCFELEMVAENAMDEDNFAMALRQIQSKTFRIGSGTRCGFGEIKVVKLYKKYLNLNNSNDLELYLSKSSNLSKEWSGWEKQETENVDNANGWIKYELTLKPEDFFLFGSGFGDEDVDITPVKEKKITWNENDHGTISEKDLILIPATSVKGALSHRVAFHYNRLNERFAGCEGDKKPKVGIENEAVQALFGYENQKEKKQLRGNLIFSDVIEDKNLEDNILNHVAIDRFTGGAIDGALFSEKTTYGKGHEFTLTVLAKENAMEGDKIKDSLEEAMKDICKGLLSLGGGVNRGNGVFIGTLKRNDVVIYSEQEA